MEGNKEFLRERFLFFFKGVQGRPPCEADMSKELGSESGRYQREEHSRQEEE